MWASRKVSKESYGHGLGMWIINNTLHKQKGKVLKILSEEGFKIVFELGESSDADD